MPGRARDVAELGGGDWSRAFSFQLDGRDLVARFGRYGEDFAKDQQAMAFAGPDLPVPEVLETGARARRCVCHLAALLRRFPGDPR